MSCKASLVGESILLDVAEVRNKLLDLDPQKSLVPQQAMSCENCIHTLHRRFVFLANVIFNAPASGLRKSTVYPCNNFSARNAATVASNSTKVSIGGCVTADDVFPGTLLTSVKPWQRRKTSASGRLVCTQRRKALNFSSRKCKLLQHNRMFKVQTGQHTAKPNEKTVAMTYVQSLAQLRQQGSLQQTSCGKHRKAKARASETGSEMMGVPTAT